MSSDSFNEYNINDQNNLKEIGINTDELDPQELKELVDNNKELKDDEVINVQVEESAQNKAHHTKNKISESIKNLTEKERIIEILKSSNKELKDKINSADSQYREIFSKLKGKSKEDDVDSLTLKLKELEKEILASNSVTEHYKKMIDSMRNKIDFKSNFERAINLENIVKIESLKNKEIKKEFDSLMKLNDIQEKALNNYDKENRITEKIDLLKSEIKSIKESIKDCQEKNTKQDKYIKHIHSRMSLFEMNMKKFSIPKVENKKNFTKEEFMQNLEMLNNLKNEIREKRKKLANITKHNEDKFNSLLNLNKKLELDFKENDKLNKMLIYKKNELRKLFRQNGKSIEKENSNKINKDPQIISEKPNTFEISSENLRHISNKKTNNENPKLFSKNPNRNNLQPIKPKNEDDSLDNKKEREEADLDEEKDNMINDSYDDEIKNEEVESNLSGNDEEDQEEEEDEINEDDNYKDMKNNVIQNFEVELI